MGTNYYRRRIPTEEELSKLHSSLDKYIKGEIFESEFTDMVNDIIKETHICKMSYGWKVLFDHNWGKLYTVNRKGLEDFLNEPNTFISDEYGDKYTPEQFWEIVKSHNDHPKNIYTSKLYRELNNEYSDSYYCKEYIDRCRYDLHIDCGDETDFEIDGLRFAVFSDFS